MNRTILVQHVRETHVQRVPVFGLFCAISIDGEVKVPKETGKGRPVARV